MTRFLRVLAASLLLALAPLQAFAADVTVFGAASLADALKEISANYEKQSGKQVAVSLAASSALARQIEASGGADVFISADEDWMDYLGEKGLLAAGTRSELLGNRLVLVGPRGVAPIAIRPGFDLKGLLKGGRLAIADPQSVPAGKYGKEALTTLNAWDGVALAPAE